MAFLQVGVSQKRHNSLKTLKYQRFKTYSYIFLVLFTAL